jgi:thiol-disulfide isomerase/thioredoxin
LIVSTVASHLQAARHSASCFDITALNACLRRPVTDYFLIVYADWCAPCKQVAPFYEDLASKLASHKFVALVKVDTESHKDIASKYQVTSLPTFVIFRNGAIVDKVEGADPRRLANIVTKLGAEIEAIGKSGGASGSGGSVWLGADLPRGYSDVTDQIEIKRCEVLNFDTEAGSVRVLFDPAKPSALSGAKEPPKDKDWVESDTDEQLMLFAPFQSMLKLHTLQVSFSNSLTEMRVSILILRCTDHVTPATR